MSRLNYLIATFNHKNSENKDRPRLSGPFIVETRSRPVKADTCSRPVVAETRRRPFTAETCMKQGKFKSINYIVELCYKKKKKWYIKWSYAVNDKKCTALTMFVLYIIYSVKQKKCHWLKMTCFLKIESTWKPLHEKTCLREFPTRSDSKWPAQIQKLAWGLKFWLQKLETLHYLGSEQQRRWSDCADAQADLRLCCSHMT